MKNFDKLFDATAYILYLNGKSMNYTKLIKELYFSDREALRTKGFSITGDIYYSMKKGPVLSNLLNLIKGTLADSKIQEKWNDIFQRSGRDVISIKKENFSLKSLSPNEEKILKTFSDKFKDMDWNDVVNNYAHNPQFCPEWDRLSNGRKRLPLSKIFETFSLSKEEIKIAVNENKFYENY